MKKFFPCFSCGSKLEQEAPPTEEDKPRPTGSNRPVQSSATVATIPTSIQQVQPATSSQPSPPVASVSSPETGPPATNPTPESLVRRTVSSAEDDRPPSSASARIPPPSASVINNPTSSSQIVPAASLPPAQPGLRVATDQQNASATPDSRLT
jgi:hypothetical protein